MKTILRTLTMMSAMIIVLLLSNCSKDDPAPDDVIVGKWTIASADATITEGSLSLVDYYISMGNTEAEAQLAAEETEAGHEEIQGGTLEFKNGGTFTAFTYGDEYTGAWELSSDRKTLTTDKGTAQEYVFTIATLTSANLNMTMVSVQGTRTVVLELELTK